MENLDTTLGDNQWVYGTLGDAVTSATSNISLNKIKEDDGPYAVFGARGYMQNVSFFHQENDYLAIIKDGAGIGRVSELPAKSSVLATMQYLLPKTGYELRFIKYFLESIDFDQYRTGSTIPHIYFKDYKSEPFPILSITEQQRIIAILDEAFADIEQVRTKTEQNLKNARELYLSKKAELFESLEEIADLKFLPSICEEIFAGGDAPKKGLFSKTKTEKYQIPVYANAVKNSGLYGFTDYSRANKPSITIAARGSGTGHIELRREPFLPIVRLIVLSPNEDVVYLDYFKHALQNLDILRSGSAIPQLTVPMIKEYLIPVPDLKIQQKTIEELEALEELIELMTERYNKKVVLLDELKKSILQKAFSGELTQKNNQGAVA
ncbi:MAG: restriction endonuclease subunit S [Thiopseudomonas sp.]|nr:restriction endonuclease subunit S [Thiopseudomonas sp.]MCK9465547.1 restriction endonuclease subunit S [Thiopseudomonas sp.]